MELVTSIQSMHDLAERLRREGKVICFVPTMGYLHQGHLILIQEGKSRGDILVVSIFINPTQFGVGEDYAVYPHDLEKDIKLAESVGTDFLFVPTVKEMYPESYQTFVVVEEVTKNLCSLSRPTHFRGVTTVVTKLFNIVRPDVAIFGEKDFQQLITLRRMVKDLNFDIEIVGMPIYREEDGLAMSSRNIYLNHDERKAALSLHYSLLKAVELFSCGERSTERIIGEVSRILGAEKLVTIDYICICDTENLRDLAEINTDAVLAVAAKVGKTRLIDNVVLRPSQ